VTRKGAHIIENYSSVDNTIECTCGWKGNAEEEWTRHRLDNRNDPVKRKKPKIRNEKGYIPF